MSSSSLQSPAVSIITPCFNGAHYLQETLESAFGQTRPPLEVIVIDDGSTDDSAAIAERFEGPVRVIRQENQGESVARNRGIELARGSHLLFLDADDLLHPEALERLVGAVGDDPRAVALMGYSVFLDPDRNPVRTIQPKVKDFLATIMVQNPGAPHCYLTPVEVVKAAGGFCDSLVYFEDWDFWCQVALTEAPLVPVDFVGAFYRRHPAAQTRCANQSDRKLGHVRVIERFLDGLLESDRLTEAYGAKAFWPAWAALQSSREMGIPWADLRPLTRQMERLLRVGPAELRKARFGRLARMVGFPLAMSLQRTPAAPSKPSRFPHMHEARDQQVSQS